VTGNGTLSSLDAARILQLAVGNIGRLPVAAMCDSDWLFTPTAGASEGQRMITPEMSAGSCTPGALAFEPLTADHTGRNFEARVFGDCSGNWTPPATAGLRGASRSTAAADLIIGRPQPRGRHHVEMPIWLRTRRPVYSLDVRIDARRTRARFRRTRMPQDTVLQHGRSAHRISIALASASALPSSSIRIGSLIMERSGVQRRLQDNVRVEAFANDVAIRVHLAR
jgi:hypothetical protein